MWTSAIVEICPQHGHVVAFDNTGSGLDRNNPEGTGEDYIVTTAMRCIA